MKNLTEPERLAMRYFVQLHQAGITKGLPRSRNNLRLETFHRFFGFMILFISVARTQHF